MNHKKNLYLIMALVIAIITGCSKASSATQPALNPQQQPALIPESTQVGNEAQPATEAAAAAAPADSTGVYRPLAQEKCQLIHDNVSVALNTKFSLSEKSLDDFRLRGGGCFMEAKGTGANFDLVNSLKIIEGVLTEWTPTDKYVQNGAAVTVRSYKKGNAIIVLGIGWKPAPGTNCPSNQPVTSCPLTPEQKIYKITLVAAEK